MTAQLYWHPLSPPARMVYFFAKAAGINLDLQFVDLTKGDQKKPEFLAINPNGQVPALKDGGFVVFESAAIIRYLAAKHPNSVFPTSDPKAQATIDQYAELIKSKLMQHTGTLFFNTLISKKVFNRDPDENAIKTSNEALATSFAALENFIFHDSPNFVVGSSLSLADVFLGVLLAALSLLNYNLDPYPKVKAYWAHLQTVQSFIDSHAPFFAAAQAFKS